MSVDRAIGAALDAVCGFGLLPGCGIAAAGVTAVLEAVRAASARGVTSEEMRQALEALHVPTEIDVTSMRDETDTVVGRLPRRDPSTADTEPPGAA